MRVGSIDAEGMKKVCTTKVRMPTATRTATMSTTAHSMSHRLPRLLRCVGGRVPGGLSQVGGMSPPDGAGAGAGSASTGPGVEGAAIVHGLTVLTGAEPRSHRPSSELDEGGAAGRS